MTLNKTRSTIIIHQIKIILFEFKLKMLFHQCRQSMDSIEILKFKKHIISVVH